MKSMALYTLPFAILFNFSAHADERCETETISTLNTSSFELKIPSIEVNAMAYQATFKFIGNIDGKFSWKLFSAPQKSALADDCMTKAQLNNNIISLSQINANNGDIYSANFELSMLSGDFFLSLIDYQQFNNNNHAPVASSLSQQVEPSILYQIIHLIATDADGDSLSYELLSADTGIGYSSAYINPLTAKLYVTLNENFMGTLAFQYRVSDGLQFSPSATVTLTGVNQIETRSLGLEEVPPEIYAGYDFSSPNSRLLGAPATVATLPSQIDLSDNFPVPGDQGSQNSCVGWAAAYALKSYQEKLELDWSLNTTEHVFSPGFIYNQINNGKDNGSFPHEALELIVNSGAATWASMPYVREDPFSQPNQAAFEEASHYKAASWSALATVQDIKASLANRNPVLIGIKTHQQLYQLSGNNSVFNDFSGNPLGGHAVTVVGYDDNQFGGAFRIINSWGTGWGDNGYFWLPYNNNVLLQAYALSDADNSGMIPVIPEQEKTEPTPMGALPNLVVSDWNLNYDARPNGEGQLIYKISNIGTAPAPAGAYVNLMLSTDEQINSNDIFAVYEQIPFELAAGEFAFRDEESFIRFNFPTDLQAGEYHLALWVDNTNVVTETNENDNVSLAGGTLSFANSLPDLNIESWFAEIFDQKGNSGLIYSIRNSGVGEAAAGWDINLVLSNDPLIGNGDETYLVYETVPFSLASGENVFRDSATSLSFNIFQDIAGVAIPSGNYYMAFWVDDQKIIAESNEDNNFSLNSGLIPINRSRKKTKLPFTTAYNGKVLPTSVSMQKIRISKTANGENKVTLLGKKKTVLQQLPKTMNAYDQIVFPLTKGLKMPKYHSVKK